MAMISRNKYEVSDPAYYDPLIAEQKSRVRQNPNDAKEWLELGRLHEAKIDMIGSFAKHHFAIRYSLPINVFLFLSVIILFSVYLLKSHHVCA